MEPTVEVTITRRAAKARLLKILLVTYAITMTIFAALLGIATASSAAVAAAFCKFHGLRFS